MTYLLSILKIDISNPTVVGGLFGILGSILGAIAGALLTKIVL